jgi:dipeptidyl aminopeptidase/acylaminoacyl peptidase
VTSLRRIGGLAALGLAPIAAAYRFALIYRARAGFPNRHVLAATPADRGLPFEPIAVASGELSLPGWFIPANDGAPGPGVVLVHGWDSARDRTVPYAEFLHAAGFHVLTFDVRGNGENGPEILPITVGEYGADTLAAFRALLARPEVIVGGIVGHSFGGIGALLAAAVDPRIAAVASTSAPADPTRLTRLTFDLARLPLPDPLAYPLAWLTTRVYLRPRRHQVRDVSASHAVGRIHAPLLLVHGAEDAVVPPWHMKRLATAARHGRSPSDPPLETLVVPGGRHSWLHEHEVFRRTLAGFLARNLGGRLDPDQAAEAAAAVEAPRLPEVDEALNAAEAEPGGLRSLAAIVMPGGRPLKAPAATDRAGWD